MFDILKKKLNSFVKGITEKVAGTAQQNPPAEETPQEERTPAAEQPKEIIAEPAKEIIRETQAIIASETPKLETAQYPAMEIRKEEPSAPVAKSPSIVKTPEKALQPQEQASKKIPEETKPTPITKKSDYVSQPMIAEVKPKVQESTQAPKPFAAAPVTAQAPTVWKPSEGKQRDIAPDLGIVSKIKGIFSSQVEITEAETKGMFDELELALLESDVSPDTATALVTDLRKRLVGKKVSKNAVEETIKEEISASVTGVFMEPPDIVGLARNKIAKAGVFTIVFIGPNGAGKTTTIAKLAQMFKQAGFYVVISASDTFRAAAIEQAGIHADKIGVKIVKQTYGSDPAAVAFDAVKHAKSVGNAVVLIDTAGRQETNRNLTEEMKKIVRVVNPDYRIFIGETLAGHSLVEQVKVFDAAVGIDGIILTKLDCDPKGGNSISIAHDAGKPIIFFGVGQEYGDLVPFDSGFVVRKVLEA